MRSEKQIQASRANGRRSHGPVTARGKAISALNATRHSLLSETVVLEGEDEDRFQSLLAAFMEEFRPATQTQLTLVETMTVARWHQLRVWGARKTALDREIALQDPAVGPRPVRALFALSGSIESACPADLLMRYDLSFTHQFNRALKHLLALKAQSTDSALAEPYFPPAPVTQTWKKIPPAERTQEDIENKPS